MQVTKITTPEEKTMPAIRRLTERQLYDELNYYRAEKLAEKMLEKGLINAEEYDNVLAEIRKIFVPILVDLL
jgi:hypothetical protein